jgi:two-component system, NarL family, nitrate/nitrite response regulator NarL
MIAQPDKILLITERPLLSLNLRQLLEGAGWSASHMVLRPDELTPAIGPDTAAVVVIDSEAGMGWETLTAACLQSPGSRFVVWCNRVTPPLVQAAMQSGVHGLLSIQLAIPEAAQVLMRVWQGERQFRFDGDMPPGPSHDPGLTAREQQVVALVTQGRRNREIAETLHTTEGSVKVYLNRIFSKTGARSRHELALTGPAIMQRLEFHPPAQPVSQHAAGGFDSAWMSTGGPSDFQSIGVPYDSFKR